MLGNERAELLKDVTPGYDYVLPPAFRATNAVGL
jgi:hypothetical protein